MGRRESNVFGEAVSWSRTPPSEPGHYWVIQEWQRPDWQRPVIREVYESYAGVLRMNGRPTKQMAPGKYWWWHEPIEPPPWPAMDEKP